MELKNITPFERFKKILEASIPSEFQNKTGFAESLVGRALFSIIRYFKQGVDMGRLQYMKNKLENEYFAGLLRFCALKNIDLQNPVDPSTKKETQEDNIPENDGEDNGEQTTQEDEYPIICSLFFMDYTKKNQLQESLDSYTRWKEGMEATKGDYETDEVATSEINSTIEQLELFIECANLKININREFEILHPYHTRENVTFTDEQAGAIIASLDKIIAFLKDEKKNYCPKYKLTPEVEQVIIDKIGTCGPDTVKNKCIEINRLIGKVPTQPQPQAQPQAGTTTGTAAESLNYKNDKMLLEKIGSGVKISQILGDVLNTAGASGQTSQIVDTKSYLAKIGITTVDQIDFKTLAEIFKQHPTFKEEVAKLVSLEGIRNIQYVVARIIYRISKTPTYTGITPEKGGGVDYKEDSALRTYWERLVEKAKGEWVYFIDIDGYNLDPFKARTLQDAFRDSSSDGDKINRTVVTTTTAMSDISNIEKVGLRTITGSPRENSLSILQVSYNDKISYILCSLHNSHIKPESKVYRYLGNINLHKIFEDKLEKDPDVKNKVSDYATSIYDANHDTKGCNPDLKNFLKMDFLNKNRTGSPEQYYLNGIYFGFSNFISHQSNDTPVSRNTRFLYFYLKETVLNTATRFTGYRVKPGRNDILMYSSDGRRPLEPIEINDLKNSPMFKWKVGAILTFEDDTWQKAYFPNINQITNGIIIPTPITAVDYSTMIIFK